MKTRRMATSIQSAVWTASKKISILQASRDTQPEEWSKSDFKEENNHSLVIRVQFGASKFLFPGDMQDAAIESLDPNEITGPAALRGVAWPRR